MTTWNSLRISLVQQASGLEPDANRALLAELTPEGSDLVVFPEVFARDFGKPGSDLSSFAESQDGPFGTELSRVARERAATVVAGMLETSGDPEGRPFNTLLVRGGAEAAYRKIHLYDSFGYKESDALVAGSIEPVVVDIDGVPTGLMTCYDLRFPELARRLVDQGAELIVLPAAWVAGPRKVDHWRTLVRARAIENTVFIAAAAQSAPRYCGHSMVVDPLGDVLAEAGDGEEIVSATIDRAVLEEARRTNPSLVNRRM
ncbi:Predicted amidohydrolase [Nocardioides sp. YR527]|uniref:carbon-nitrogen hydrolase family protein n=1 Tax=Nocardioides sp. YR527 TaxID=1881028 RepID=UPI000880A8FA|nr:carbon-nitrogen hydrolase family protein [Nocardioides sp. YR527]SDK21110.1 Predicted amidohydrolase [Nocardioides sp. YR527]